MRWSPLKILAAIAAVLISLLLLYFSWLFNQSPIEPEVKNGDPVLFTHYFVGWTFSLPIIGSVAVLAFLFWLLFGSWGNRRDGQ